MPGNASDGASTPAREDSGGHSSTPGSWQQRPVYRGQVSQAASFSSQTSSSVVGGSSSRAAGSSSAFGTADGQSRGAYSSSPTASDFADPPASKSASRDDRIKSRQVDPSGWNWEAEKARMEEGANGARPGPGARQGSLSAQGVPPQERSRSYTAGPGGAPLPRGPLATASSSSSLNRPQLRNIDTSGAGNNARAGSGGGKDNQLSPGSGGEPIKSSVPHAGDMDTPRTPRQSAPPTTTSASQQQQQQLASSASSSALASAAAASGNAPAPRAGGSGRKDQTCDACGKPMTGQFVRALGVVYHLDCFRCRDCNKVVASKFFPATDEMHNADSGKENADASAARGETSKQNSPSGKLFPLCETDYFRRLDLICAKCGGALRGSYITALGKKFHVEHFTCSVCPTVFGPQDSYYEHDGGVFCHFHYSTRFAIRCTGCRTAILKQFVEINRNDQDEHWHPECYMIHKFWNIKLCPTGSTPRDTQSLASEPNTTPLALEPSKVGTAPVTTASAFDAPTIEALETEASETPSSLKQKQKQMEEQVYRIWTVLSAFEESSAACISEMLRHVSSGRYLNGVRMAERFILHVEILFSAIDDLERAFKKEQVKGISHIREARMLCKKIVNFFSLLSHTQETGAQRMGITQELLSLVTGLAHYLKILIRIALTGALRLDRDYGNRAAISWFMDQLAHLARDTGDDASAAAAAAAAKGPNTSRAGSEGHSSAGHESNVGSGPGAISIDSAQVGPDGQIYGYRSLPRSTSGSSEGGRDSATDLCVKCGQTVEEECVRIGVNMRFHTSCVRCATCRRPAWKPPSTKTIKPPPSADGEPTEQQQAAQPPPAPPVDPDLPEPIPAVEFFLDAQPRAPMAAAPEPGALVNGRQAGMTYSLYCPGCRTASSRSGLEAVTRLEQYAFLLRVALNRLHALLKKRGVVPASPPLNSTSTGSARGAGGAADGGDGYRPERDSGDIKRIRSVNLDRKLSTKAKMPHISTIVGSPSGQQTMATAGSRTSPTELTATKASGGAKPAAAPSPRPGDRSPSPRSRDNVGAAATAATAATATSAAVAGRTGAPHQQQQHQPPYGTPRPPGAMPTSRDPSPSRRPGPPPMPNHQPPPLPSSGGAGGSIVPIRPAFARHNTDVQVRDDTPQRQASGDERTELAPALQEEGLTLADIPQILQAEQANQQHRPPPSSGGRLISELSALEVFIIKHMALLMLQQGPLKDLVSPEDLDLLEFIETRKANFWGKLFKGNKDKKKETRYKGTFGVPLEIMVERGTQSTFAGGGNLRVPALVEDVIAGMMTSDVPEGIFRKSGNQRKLRLISEELDRDPSTSLADENPIQLAVLIKKWLRELPDPLLTFRLHPLWTAAAKLEPEERRKCLHLIFVLLPKAHRDTAEVLLRFIRWVSNFSAESLMDIYNLAITIAPNILYARGSDPHKDETFLSNRAVEALLNEDDEFLARVPPELEACLNDRELLSSINTSADNMTSRDMVKELQKHMKRSRNRAGSSAPPGQQGGVGSGNSTSNGGSGGGYAHGMPQGGPPGAQGAGQYRPGGDTGPHRPTMHGPATMRQVANGPPMPTPHGSAGPATPSHYHANGGAGGGGSWARSPIEQSQAPPWAQQPQQQQPNGNGLNSAAGGYQQQKQPPNVVGHAPFPNSPNPQSRQHTPTAYHSNAPPFEQRS